MTDILNTEKGPLQALFGDDASVNPMIILPIAFAVVVILLILAIRIILNDKGRSEMTEEELEKDRALFDKKMEKEAAYKGQVYVPERARAAEAAEIAEAKRRYGK